MTSLSSVHAAILGAVDRSLCRDGEGRWRPWREVTHIATRDTRGGGKCWFLTLVCGHYKTVSVPFANNPVLAVRRRRIILAPQRVRCVLCPVEDQPTDNSSGSQ